MARDRSRPGNDRPVRITTAAASADDDLAGRQRRYVVSMTIRTFCFIGAIFAALAGLNWLWPILMVAALLLPYVAVVMANARHTRGDDFELVEHRPDHPQLGSGPNPPQSGFTRG